MYTQLHSPNSKCCKCEKTVYATELVAVLNKIWHSKCLTCENCNKTLNLFNMCTFDSKPYCRKCYDHWSVQQTNVIVQTNLSNDEKQDEHSDSSLISSVKTDDSISFNNEKIINVLVFGESGAGKSSLINMLLDEDVCETSSNALGCTTESKANEIVLDEYGGMKLCIYDTAGLGESEHGTISNKNAFLRLVETLYKTKKNGGIHLLICCHRNGNKISTETFKQNYHSFLNIICENEVPSILCITHCDQDKKLDLWIDNNQSYVREQFRDFRTILTLAANKHAKHLDLNEYYFSRKKTLEAILKYSLDQPWKMISIRKNLLILFKQLFNTIQKRISFLKIYPLNDEFLQAFLSLGFDKQQAIHEANALFHLLNNSTKN